MRGTLHPHLLASSTSGFLQTKVLTTELLFFGCLLSYLMILTYIVEFRLIIEGKGYGDRILFVLVFTNEVVFPFKATQLYCSLKP